MTHILEAGFWPIMNAAQEKELTNCFGCISVRQTSEVTSLDIPTINSKFKVCKSAYHSKQGSMIHYILGSLFFPEYLFCATFFRALGNRHLWLLST